MLVSQRPSFVLLVSVLALGGTWTRSSHAVDAGTDAAVEHDAASVSEGHDAALESSTPTAPRHVVGLGCSKDNECAPGLKCLLPSGNDLGAGGPAGGLCSKECAAQADCDSVDTGSICLSGHCFERCTLGVPAVNTYKCHERSNVACSPVGTTGQSACAPSCLSDSDCGARKCDLGSGLCVDKITGTLPLGSACDPDATTTACEGQCLYSGFGARSVDNSICSASCSLIGTKSTSSGCGQIPGARIEAACIIPLSANEAPGDQGACAALCDCDSDCKNPKFLCQPFDVTSLGFALSLGRSGTCVPGASNPTNHLDCKSKDGGAGSGGASSRDSGVAADGSSATPGATPSKASGGCGCHVGGSADSRSDAGAFVGVALALGLATRRRRRSA